MHTDCSSRIRLVYWGVIYLGVVACCCCPPGRLTAEEFSRQQLDDFERQIRPILVDHCLSCHGEEKQENGLRLDTRAALLEGGDRGPAVVPGDVDKSVLVQAISYETDDLAMPPDGKLTDDQISQLRHWVEQGVPWPVESETAEPAGDVKVVDTTSHWAFRPIAKPKLPEVRDRSWPTSPIDYFVLAKLEQAGLAPSLPASERVLVRRAYLDLIGLPPPWDVVETLSDAESDDEHPARWIKLVDRLLSRREYGERWARHWLDVARYADTKGYIDGGQVRFAFAYTYRDYVVRAFNEDLRFDEFIIDQVAADQLQYPPDHRWRLAGMGFLTDGRRFNNNDQDIIDDRIDVISRGLQGMTVSCARCHDHKYDPVSTEDYYSLYGIFANSFEPTHAELPVLGEEPDTTEYREYLAELNKRSETFHTEFKELHQRIEHELRAYAGDYLVYLVLETPRHRDRAQNPLRTERTVLRGPAAYGFGAIRRWRRFVASRTTDDPVFGLWHQMDGVDRSAFSSELSHRLTEQVNAVLASRIREAKPRSMVELAKVYGTVLEESYHRWTECREAHPKAQRLEDPDWEQLRRVLYGPDTPPDMTPYESIDCYSLNEHTHMRSLVAKVEELSLDREDVPPRAMILGRRKIAYQPQVFLRGQPNRPGPRVSRRIPDVFRMAESTSGEATGSDDRLSLARAMVAPTNTLTARVIVNRVWQWHFGDPLVSTPSDFGLRSHEPLHAELLDFLASWFMENEWSLKRLHRLIMNSSTYRQLSLNRPKCAAVDPGNQLLWRFNARRLEWEVIRDSLLAVSGRLSHRAGGRPVELAPDDPDSTCRTIYLLVDRQEISRFARNYDFPAPDFTSPGRPRTTVPQQQLFFLNSPFVIEQARTLGCAAAKMSQLPDEEKFVWLHQRILGRKPDVKFDSLKPLRASLCEQGAVPDEAKFWSTIAHALLQSNEFIYFE